MTTTHRKSFAHLVVCQHSTQCRTPVHFQVCQICNTIVHQHLLLTFFVPRVPLFCCEYRSFAACSFHFRITLFCKNIHQHRNRTCCICTIAIPVVKHLYKSPLSPFVVAWLTCAHFATPIVAEAYFIQLLTIASDILFCCDSRVLTCLNSILFCWKSVCVITHWVQHIESLQSLIAAINIRCNITEWVTHVQSSSRWVWEHIKHIEFRTRFVNIYFISGIIIPILLPFFLNFLKFVFHIYIVCLYYTTLNPLIVKLLLLFKGNKISNLQR